MKLICISCQQEYKPEKGRYYCDGCGPYHGTLEVVYAEQDYRLEHFDPYRGIRQFIGILPVSKLPAIADHIGGSPLSSFENCLGFSKLYVKYDGMNPSASYKDRASIIAIERALEEGAEGICCASTGNAASSLALLAAPLPLDVHIFVPASIPPGKLSQLVVAGAHVYPMEGSYDEVFDLSLKIGLQEGWYIRHSAINPYLLEGKKTGAVEVAMHLQDHLPDYCFVGVGDGTIISGLLKGFAELKAFGYINKIPKVIGVQATGASTLTRVFEKGPPYQPIQEEVTTIADSVQVGNPRDVIKACTYLSRYGGDMIRVSDQSIKKAIYELAEATGFFAEPAGAIALAGAQAYLADHPEMADQSVCIFVTGNGLKDFSAVMAKASKTFTKEELMRKWGVQDED